MTQVKICGLKDSENLQAAIKSGVHFIGLVFYPPSPRHVTPAAAAKLAAKIPSYVKTVGLFVNPTDQELEEVTKNMRLDLIQLHGTETPERVRAIKVRFSVPVMKAIRVGGPEDLVQIAEFEDAADWLLFDARPPEATLPGGTGQSFDWSLLAGKRFARPWMLSGGLNPDNVARALSVVQPDAVDVSSGVETAPGIKNPGKIGDFIKAVQAHG